MSATFIEFLPRMITQTEVLQSGGTQVIDNIICTADGQPIRESKMVPIMLSLDLTGKKPHQYGALNVPPVSATLAQLMTPIHPNEVIDFTNSYLKKAKSHHADQFVNFINTYFLHSSDLWRASLLAFDLPPLFLVKIDHYTDTSYKTIDNTVYLKYYNDVKDYIGCNLGILNIQTYVNGTALTNNAMSLALGLDIPDYNYLMLNPTEAQQWYKILTTSTFSNISNNYSDLFTNTDTATAYLASHDTTVTPTLSNIKVDCSY